MDLDRTTHDLSRDSDRVEVTNYWTWWHTGVHLLNNNLVRGDVAFFSGTASFSLLEFSEELERVQTRRGHECWLHGTFEQGFDVLCIIASLLPSKAHQLLLCDLNTHVGSKLGTHSKHCTSRDAVNVDDSNRVAAVEQRDKILDGIFLPGDDLRNQLITSTI